MRPPPREEGRIINCAAKLSAQCNQGELNRTTPSLKPVLCRFLLEFCTGTGNGDISIILPPFPACVGMDSGHSRPTAGCGDRFNAHGIPR